MQKKKACKTKNKYLKNNDIKIYVLYKICTQMQKISISEQNFHNLTKKECQFLKMFIRLGGPSLV